MATDVEIGAERRSMTSLVSGIFTDAEDLIKQQFALFRLEIKQDVHKILTGSALLIVGIALALLAVMLFCFTLVYLLSWLAPSLPLWACFGIVGLLFVIVGGALIAIGIYRFRSVDPLHDQAAEALRETIQWKTTPR
jgi:hypothetical protein